VCDLFVKEEAEHSVRIATLRKNVGARASICKDTYLVSKP
jgi:hypothetical protein